MRTDDEERLALALRELVADQQPSPQMHDRVADAVQRSGKKRHWPTTGLFVVVVAVALATGQFLSFTPANHHRPSANPPVTSGTSATSVTTPPLTNAPVTPATNPPVTNPPLTSAPVTPVTHPPATAVTHPPITAGTRPPVANPTTTTSQTTTTATTVVASPALILVGNCDFNLSASSWPTGTTVRFRNQGDVEVAVFGDGPAGAGDATFQLPPGDDAFYTLHVPGEYSFSCDGGGDFVGTTNFTAT